ncbi:MAG: hypothetical protein CR984_02010 [Proteobacteria bacterium]|nr:MAG: hypothetical protein CR984_02010 [Pseudomonadota bacterium]
MAWYYKDGENDIGPIDKSQLQALFKQKKINAATLIRNANKGQWRPLKEWVGPKKEDAAKPPENESRQPSSPFPADIAPVPSSDESIPSADDNQPQGGQPTATETAVEVCSQCGHSFPQDQVICFEDRTICAACKPIFVQKLKEGVDLPTHLPYAGFWIRAAAKIIDTIALMVAQWAILIPLNLLFFSSVDLGAPDPDTASLFGMIGTQMIVGLLIPGAYATFFIGRFSATPGKMLCRLKVTAPDGGPVSYLRAFGRFWAELVSSMIMCIGYLMVAFDSEKRALHDRICATRVIRTQETEGAKH